MAEMEPGHPDELVQQLKNWLREAHDPIGSLPERTDPVEWAIRRFIASWKGSARRDMDSMEESLNTALRHLEAGTDVGAAKDEIDNALSVLNEDLRNHLGLYPWNREDD